MTSAPTHCVSTTTSLPRATASVCCSTGESPRTTASPDLRRLPLERVRPLVRQALFDGAEITTITLPARDRRGRDFTCGTTVIPLRLDGDQPTGVIVLSERAEAA